MKRAVPLMIQGTSSDAGKSVLVTAFCRIFAQQGYKTAPFKSQNMALNSIVTPDGKEIGRAQGVQAEAAGIPATTYMNPILIKPSRESESQIVVHGKPYKMMKAAAYRSEFFPLGLELIKDAYAHLADQYERIVIEGAGSPAEINLNDRELVNMRVARIANAPVILVADIERGGVFASLVGTLQLLEQEDRDRVIGVIINKFRGDPALLESGLRWFEEYTGKRVLGVVPYIPNLYIDAEDSLVLDQFKHTSPAVKEIDIAVIRYPRISNFTDIDPLLAEADCRVRFVKTAAELGEPDLILLPGSKNTIEDLQFLRNSGLETRIKERNAAKQSWIIGICGGYQMLGERIEDPDEVESNCREIDGMGLLPLHTSMTQEKTTILSEGIMMIWDQEIRVEGYEIHMGQSVSTASSVSLIRLTDRSEGSLDAERNVMGTYFHGILHNDEFRKLLLNRIRIEKGLQPLEERMNYGALRQQGFDTIAASVLEHVQFDYIHDRMIAFSEEKGWPSDDNVSSHSTA